MTSILLYALSFFLLKNLKPGCRHERVLAYCFTGKYKLDDSYNTRAPCCQMYRLDFVIPMAESQKAETA